MPSLFTIPLELRNHIYHHLFTSDPYLSSDFYKGLHLTTHYATRCCALQFTYDLYDILPSTPPTWLLTSKTLMREALEQYSLHASWVLDEPLSRERARSYKLPLDKSKIRRLEISVGFLPNWSAPWISYGEDPKKALWRVAEASRCAGLSFESLRFQGHTYEPELEYCSARSAAPSQVARIFDGMRVIFEGVLVREWFLEVAPTLQCWKTEVVFTLKGTQVVVVGGERGTSAARKSPLEREHTDWCKVFVAKTETRMREEETLRGAKRKECRRKVREMKRKFEQRVEERLKQEGQTPNI